MPSISTEYCKTHTHDVPCKHTGGRTTALFCKVACRGRPAEFKSPPIKELRDKLRLPLNDAQLNDKDLVSVVIPVCDADGEWIERTVKSVGDNAVGPIEILCDPDVKHVGHRVLMNRMARRAKGKYLLRLDAHCAMSPGWDARMKASCGPKTIVKVMLDALDQKKWTGGYQDAGFIALDSEFNNTYPKWKQIGMREIEEPSMSIAGCCWMIQKDHYWQHDGCDEELGIREGGGLEWALKAWLTGGEVLIRTDVVCCHLYRPPEIGVNDAEKTCEPMAMLAQKWASGMGKGQIYGLYWLAHRFEQYLEFGESDIMQDEKERI